MGMVVIEGLDRVKSEKAEYAERRLNHPEKRVKPQSKTSSLKAQLVSREKRRQLSGT